MKWFRMIVFFPLALLRLVMVLTVTAAIASGGMVWLKIFGFSRRLQAQALKLWGRSLLFICGIKVTKNSIPSPGRFILMSNHRSYLDIFVLAAYMPAAFVAKAEVQIWPMMKIASRLTGILFVSRSELKSMVATMHRIKEMIHRGIPVALFPEGTTYRGPLTKPFKMGSFKIAADLGIPVIPAAIHFEDEEDAWVDEDTFVGHFFRQMGKPLTHVRLQVGNPVSEGDYRSLSITVKKEIDSMLQQILSKGGEGATP